MNNSKQKWMPLSVHKKAESNMYKKFARAYLAGYLERMMRMNQKKKDPKTTIN